MINFVLDWWCSKKTVFRTFILFFVFSFFVALPTFVFAHNLPVTSSFGWRYHPVTGKYSFHTGVDLGYEEGIPIIALFDGQVMQAGDYGDGYGGQVLLYHSSNDTYTRYAHMSQVTVSIGQAVSQGATIGLVGHTGTATGSHLHLEYIVRDANGVYQYVDPLILWGG